MVQTEKGCCIRAKLISFFGNRTQKAKNSANYKKCRIADLIIGHVDYRSIPTLEVLVAVFPCFQSIAKLS